MKLPAFLASLVLSRQVRRATYDIQDSPSIPSLARDLERVESVREVKDVQRTFAQLAQFGRWSDIAALFTQDALFQWGEESVQGPAAIQAWLKADAGNMDGVRPGSLYAMVDDLLLIKSITPGAGGNIVLKWDSSANRTYQMQISNDLKSWSNLGGTITGTGNELSLTDSNSIAAASRRFYRLGAAAP